jgi:hypothetical protein
MRLYRHGEHEADTELRLSLVDAEHLHAALCRVLDGQPPPRPAPECRQSVQASPGTAHILGRA